MIQIDRIKSVLGQYLPDEQNFQPFHIIFYLQSPMYIGDNWYHMDAIIARMLIQDLLKDDYYNLPAKQPYPVAEWVKLPIARTGDVYNASVLIPNAQIQKVSKIYKRFDESDHLLKTKTKIRRGSGYFRDYMIQIPYAVSDKISAYVNGDLNEIKKLLRNLHALGKKTAIGGGQIKEIKYEEIEDDRSLVWNKHAMREIPLEMCEQFDVRYIMRRAIIFPYWDLRNVRMVVVPGAPVVLKPDFRSPEGGAHETY